jgi:hypothetical protein
LLSIASHTLLTIASHVSAHVSAHTWLLETSLSLATIHILLAITGLLTVASHAWLVHATTHSHTTHAGLPIATHGRLPVATHSLLAITTHSLLPKCSLLSVASHALLAIASTHASTHASTEHCRVAGHVFNGLEQFHLVDTAVAVLVNGLNSLHSLHLVDCQGIADFSEDLVEEASQLVGVERAASVSVVPHEHLVDVHLQLLVVDVHFFRFDYKPIHTTIAFKRSLKIDR